MQPTLDDIPDGIAITPAEDTYREVAEEHAERLYGYLMLLVGDRAVAERLMVDAFSRLWSGLLKANVFGDAEPILYRHATRSALQRVQKGDGLRGLLPATTADDRQVTAFGVLDSFAPQQRAAVLLSVWGGVSYALAGLATGVGEGRTRDLAFAARQEYRVARGGPTDTSPACHAIVPLLSARADGNVDDQQRARIDEHLAAMDSCVSTAELFDEYRTMIKSLRIPPPEIAPLESALQVVEAKPAGAGRGPSSIWRLASGPAILTLVLIAGLFVCSRFNGETAIKTGVGRTSDLLYAREPTAVVTIDSGSGHQLATLPQGAVDRSGSQIYDSQWLCTGSCTTTIRVTDTGTLETSDLTRLDGQLTRVAVDSIGHRLYLADAARDLGRLVVVDLNSGRVAGDVQGPSDVKQPFAPTGAVLSNDGRSLVTVGGSADGSGSVVVWTDLTTLRSSALNRESTPPGEVALASSPDSSRMYLSNGDRLAVVDPRASQPAELSLGGSSSAGTPVSPGAIAVAPDGMTYAVVRDGGIAVVAPNPFQVTQRIGQDRQFTSVAASTDGKYLYALQKDGTYVVMNPTTGEVIFRRPNVGSLAILQVNPGE